MGNITVEEKSIVVPGEELANGMDFLPDTGTYREGESIVASRLGLFSVSGRALKVIPMSGQYMPKSGDTIIGKVIDITFGGWRIDTYSAYSAMLSVKDATSSFIQKGADLTRFFNIGDSVVVQITNVTSQKLIDVSAKGPGLRKLQGGRLIRVNTNKVPRIIGKQGSMVSMIKQMTNCQITVGQNGVVWISGEPEAEILTVKTIRKIEAESHISGLTERIGEYLEKNKVK